jgi:NifU-like protein involved in Fe-S cluster formation
MTSSAFSMRRVWKNFRRGSNSKQKIFRSPRSRLANHSTTWLVVPMNDFEENVRKALVDPQNQGEMSDADSVGTVGSPECGDMLRMWLKFTEKDGQKVIDRASFQSFGCQTAIAVASMATELLKGKTLDQARALSAQELSGDLGALPPMKIHCGQLVEGALRNALDGSVAAPSPAQVPTLSDQMKQPSGSLKIKFTEPS